MHFLFLIKSTKKFSVEHKIKDNISLLFVILAFSVFWKTMDCVSYPIHHEIKAISRVKQNNEIYKKDWFFSKRSKSYHLYVLQKKWKKKKNSLENSIDNSSIQIFVFSLRLLFVTKEINCPSKISHSPTGRKPSTP